MKNLWNRLKNWIVSLSTHKYATPALAIVAFCESSFFLIPPDIMLAPMVLSDRARKWRLAFICTAASVLGGLLGYFIGYALFDLIGQPIIDSYNAGPAFEKFKSFYDDWGFWVVVISAISFIPFKIATIASGVVALNPVLFIVACIIGRAIRFYGVTYGVTIATTTDPRDWLNNPKKQTGVLMVGTLGVIGTALGFQYIGGLQPCALCLDQRIPYYFALGATPVAIWAATQNKTRLLNSSLGLIALVYVIGGTIGIYHAGVEWSFWAGPSGCSAGGIDNSTSVEALMQSLNTASIIRCDEAPWRLFGLSMAGYNALASFGLSAIAAWSLRSFFGNKVLSKENEEGSDAQKT